MIYVIRCGAYEDDIIVGLVSGDVDPHSRIAGFLAFCGIADAPRTDYGMAHEKISIFATPAATKVRLACLRLGLANANDAGMGFYTWLIKHAGYTAVEYEEVSIGDACHIVIQKALPEATP